MSSERFLELYFAEMPATEQILIWTLPDKRSSWHRTIDSAARLAASIQDRDCYFGIGTRDSRANFTGGERGGSVNVTAIYGLNADIDIAGEGHKKGNLPPTFEQAWSILAGLPLFPTIVVHSGHGLQAHWLFEHPWIFASPQEREEAEALLRHWNALVRMHVAARGWDVDSTWDLARVLRVPGTKNHKGEPVPVVIVNDQGDRYPREAFVPHLEGVPLPKARAKRTTTRRKSEPTATAETPAEGELILDEHAEPPLRKLRALEANDTKFKQAIQRKRRDLQDQSPSAYDLAIANITVRSGWTDQETVDLLIFTRTEHGDDPKLRHDYYERTLELAREGVPLDDALLELQALEAPSGHRKGAEGDSERDAKRRHISQVLGVEVRRILKYLAESPEYRIEAAEGTVTLGGVNGLISQDQLRTHLAATFGTMLPYHKRDVWAKKAQLLLDLCEEIETGPEAYLEGQIRGWLECYLDAHRPAPFSEAAVIGKQPYAKDDGRIRVSLEHVRDFLQARFMEKRTERELAVMLRPLGAEHEREHCQVEGKRSTRSVWKLPAWDSDG